jgi:2-methylcitrate dehydratase PrpD
MQTEPTLFEHLARFAQKVSQSEFPDRVLLEAKFCVLDTLGCMISGAPLPEGQAFARMESEISPGNVRVVGRDITLSEAGAARLNGYNGDILELNDLIGGHASIGSVSAVLALAQTLGLGGPAFLRSLITGIEITARVNAAYRESHGGQDNKPFTEVGVSSEGIPSTIGVSALASVAFGLRPEQIASAMAIGGTLAGWCPVEVLFGVGGTVKPLMFGSWPATVGMLAGRYAKAGMTGPTHLLESPVGLFATLAKGYDPEIIKGSLGWQLEKPRRKWHACCGFIHAGLDGVVALRQQHGASLFEDATVEISVVPPVATLMSTQKLPENETEARFSGKYCLALAMSGVDCILPSHSAEVASHLAAPQTVGRMGRISYVGLDSLPHFSHSRVRVVGPEGERAALQVAGYKGSQTKPLSHDEVIQKFLRMASFGIKQPSEYVDKVLSLERFENLDWIYDDLIVT